MKKTETTKTNMTNREGGIKTFTIEIDWLKGCVTGWGNGYIALPEGHVLFGEHYDHTDVDVHGGLTYSGEEDIDGVRYWVIGFDCAHAGDNLDNRSESYVISETERLYEQIKNYVTPLEKVTQELTEYISKAIICQSEYAYATEQIVKHLTTTYDIKRK